tara:strand:- start:3693 stop:4109 length:417 start_codon:yes stop_codon:yes gene_type:complete
MSGRKIPYPWGRIRPEKRISEIEGVIVKMVRQKEVLAHQYQESIRKIDMNIDALQAQVDVAKSFAAEDEWSELRERVYALELEGIEAMQAIYGKSISEAHLIVDELEKEEKASPASSDFDDEFLTSGISGIDDLFEGD